MNTIPKETVVVEANFPFHAGELEAQERAGVGDVASWAAGVIRGQMPEQHRAFHTSLPFLVLSARDQADWPWVTIVEGPEQFVRSPDPKTLTIASELQSDDPLAEAFRSGTDIGLLGIELATRRRNRLSGVLHREDDHYVIDIRQTFGNCPQYIREREWRRVPRTNTQVAQTSQTLNEHQIARIKLADTMFIGTGYNARDDRPSNGYDASHRGGEPGFVLVKNKDHLQIPDYSGNNFFNTIGNILENPQVGLLFVDFETGGLLHITGQAEIDWEANNAQDPQTRRIIDVKIDQVIDRPNALSLRWQTESSPIRNLAVVKKVTESQDISSFYLKATDGRPLDPFEAGQHLPIELDVPQTPGRVRRSYSLSGAPGQDGYRLSIKREDQGLASRFMHDVVQVGDVISAHRPSGDFVIPCGQCPLVLVSAGVGLTPMLAMLHATSMQDSEQPVWFLHGARNGRYHALHKEVDDIVRNHPNAKKLILYSQPDDKDQFGISHNAVGRISPEILLDLNAGPDAHYMLCGPAQFLANIRNGLEGAGVPADQIHFETFGPTG
ncbi:MAG: pyridoxamine 5'-phosphate oxidase family protein [Hyphomicrobiaceae bacterium]